MIKLLDIICFTEFIKNFPNGRLLLLYIYEMGSSYIWCNFTRVTHFLSHRFPKDLTVKKKTSSFFTSLNAYLINSILIISLLIKYFFVSFFFLSTFYDLSFFFLPSIKPLSLSSSFLARYSSRAANRSFFTLYVLLFSFSFLGSYRVRAYYFIHPSKKSF